MEAIIERCCGLDVHQATIMACLLTGKADEKPVKQLRTFGTMTQDLGELAQWLGENQCTHVAMESTGVYWMPVYKMLEGHFQLVVGNAQHLAKVPGRKTDVLDSEWLAELLRHGLIRSSFVPPPPIRELRDLTRYRRKLVQQRTGERNRLQKLLEMANIKLATVVSDVFGVSGMAIVRALVDDKLTLEEIANLAKGTLRKKKKLLELAVDGTIDEHHRYLLGVQLGRLENLDRDIAALDKRIEHKLQPYHEQYTRLMQIPGVSRVAAAGIIAELGVDMSIFPNAEACASWAGVCPGNNESAGKRKSESSRRGNPHLKTILVEAAQSAACKKGSYLRDKFYRLKARRGGKRAAMAIAHKILIAVYHMLKTGEDYRDLGANYLAAGDQQRTTQKLVRRLEGLGYEVTLEARDPDAEPSGKQTAAASSQKAGTRKLQQMDVPWLSDKAASASGKAASSGDEVDSGKDEVATTSDGGEVASGEDENISVTQSEEQDAAPIATAAAMSTARAPSEEQEHSDASRGEESAAPTFARDPAVPDTGKSSVKRKSSRKRSTGSRPKRSSRFRDPRIPLVGTILTRNFKGVEHQVRITDEGFEYRGTVYRSVSRVAKEITGTNQSGFTFFRLTKKEKTH